MSDIAMFSIDNDGVVKFSLKNITRIITGPEEALQLVAFAIFTKPGSCFFARNDGGGLLDLKGRNVGSRDALRTDCAVIVRKAMDTVKRSQGTGRAANATVVGLDLVDASGDPQTGVIKIKIRIRLQDGNSFTAAFEGQAQ